MAAWVGLRAKAPDRRAVAGDARDRVRRDAGRPSRSSTPRRATPSTCASPASSTTGASSTPSPAARTRSTACTRTRRSRRPSAPPATARSRARPRYCAVSETFWQRVALHRSYAIGGHSEDEHFSPVAHLSRHLGESTAETCNTYNMLKLTRRLFLRDADPARIDFYERGLFNHILASQDPATGMVTYYVALKPGAWRSYSTPEDSFWCCVGTGMENPARYGEAIYARQGDALLVNLFLASQLTWREKGLTLRQETRFPDEDRTRLVLRLEKPRALRPAPAPPGLGGGGLRGERERRRRSRVESRPALLRDGRARVARRRRGRGPPAHAPALRADARRPGPGRLPLRPDRAGRRPRGGGPRRQGAVRPVGPRGAPRGAAPGARARRRDAGRGPGPREAGRRAPRPSAPRASAGRATSCCGRSSACRTGATRSTSTC